ncbi:uncharacterized protein WM294_003866 [Sarcoramphus papa]
MGFPIGTRPYRYKWERKNKTTKTSQKGKERKKSKSDSLCEQKKNKKEMEFEQKLAKEKEGMLEKEKQLKINRLVQEVSETEREDLEESEKVQHWVERLCQTRLEQISSVENESPEVVRNTSHVGRVSSVSSNPLQLAPSPPTQRHPGVRIVSKPVMLHPDPNFMVRPTIKSEALPALKDSRGTLSCAFDLQVEKGLAESESGIDFVVRWIQ